MAKWVRLTDEQRTEIVNRWRCGQSQNSIYKKFPCSVATVNKLCKGIEQDNIAIVNKKVELKHELNLKSNEEVNTINLVVDERTKHLKYFQASSLRNQVIANKLLEEKKQAKGKKKLTLNDLNAHSQITQRNKDTTLGKTPETAIQINNNTEITKIQREIV